MTAPIAVHTVVIGGGQAGLAAGYHLARRSRDFVILDAAERTGDSWRHRWDFADTVRMLRGPCACSTPMPASGSSEVWSASQPVSFRNRASPAGS